jgi:hypothetical protein
MRACRYAKRAIYVSPGQKLRLSEEASAYLLKLGLTPAQVEEIRQVIGQATKVDNMTLEGAQREMVTQMDKHGITLP